jgi:DNA-binding CsgD family transcriptional regulator
MSLELLTRRQRDVVAGLAGGKKITDVAKSLGVSHNTARNHLKHAFRKLGVRSQNALTALVRAESAKVVQNVEAIHACIREAQSYEAEARRAVRANDTAEALHSLGHVHDALRRALGQSRGDMHPESYPAFKPERRINIAEAARIAEVLSTKDDVAASDMMDIVNAELAK